MNYASSKIQKMQPYKPPLANRKFYDGLLLDFNERTIPVSKKIIAALRAYLSENKIQIYPEYFDLCAKIANYAKVEPNNIMLTNGSEQGIDLIFRTFTKEKNKVIIPSPSFALFYQYAQIAGTKILMPKYGKDPSFPLNGILKLLDQKIKLLVLCNPNNPTGTLIPLSDLKIILKKAFSRNILVYIDEAYYEFSKITAAELVKKYPNLIITRTFSKAFGLASLRIGYLISNAENLAEIEKIRGPYDINMPACIAAKAALDNLSEMKKYVSEVMQRSKPLMENFFLKNGLKFFPSQANFILFKPDQPKKVFQYLKKSGIMVRPRDGANIDQTIRVTIGTVEQTQKFIKTMSEKFAFVDRDGSLIYEPTPEDTRAGDVPYQIDSIAKVKILPGVIDGLKKLTDQGYKLVMVSNQTDLGKKIFPRANFEKAQRYLLKIFRKNGIIFKEIFICPHSEKDYCLCRKPRTGLLKKFFNENIIDMKNSFVYGDRKSDKQLARNLGIKYIGCKTNGPFTI